MVERQRGEREEDDEGEGERREEVRVGCRGKGAEGGGE